MRYSRYIVEETLGYPPRAFGKSGRPYSREIISYLVAPLCLRNAENVRQLCISSRQQPQNYMSRADLLIIRQHANERNSFLFLGGGGVCARCNGTQCYTTRGNFHYAARLCYANRDACLSGRSLMRCSVLNALLYIVQNLTWRVDAYRVGGRSRLPPTCEPPSFFASDRFISCPGKF